MKKLLTVLLVTMMAFCLCGCENISKEDVEKVVEKTGEVLEKAEEAVGEWMIDKNIQTAGLADDVKAIFDKGVEGFTGQSFEPIVLIGKQVVSGMNYMFLAKGTTTTAEPKTALKIVTIYNDLKNNASVKSVADFNILDFLTDNTLNVDQLAGGWNIDLDAKEIDAEPLKKATEGLTGVSYKPIALLGSQEVAGKNYCYLTIKTVAAANPISVLAIVDVFEDTKKNCEILSVCDLDLKNFVATN